MKAHSTVSKYVVMENSVRNIDKITARWIFVARHSPERPTKNMKTGQAVLTKCNKMQISIYDSSLPSPHTVASPIKVTRSGVLGNSKRPSPPVQVHRNLASSLQNDIQITAYCAISSFMDTHWCRIYTVCASHNWHTWGTHPCYVDV
jgi:hypothetical protein